MLYLITNYFWYHQGGKIYKITSLKVIKNQLEAFLLEGFSGT